MGEIDGLGILTHGHLAHLGTDRGYAAQAFDEPLHFTGPAAFESGHAKSGEGWGSGVHGRMYFVLKAVGEAGQLPYATARADGPIGGSASRSRLGKNHGMLSGT